MCPKTRTCGMVILSVLWDHSSRARRLLCLHELHGTICRCTVTRCPGCRAKGGELTARRRSVKRRPGPASPVHPPCPLRGALEELRFHATVICSIPDMCTTSDWRCTSDCCNTTPWPCPRSLPHGQHSASPDRLGELWARPAGAAVKRAPCDAQAHDLSSTTLVRRPDHNISLLPARRTAASCQSRRRSLALGPKGAP